MASHHPRGTVVVVNLGSTEGREQGTSPPPASPYRPCVIVSDAGAVIASPYFELYSVVPLTSSFKYESDLAPRVSTPGPKDPAGESIALVHQVRTIDPVRIRRTVNSLTTGDLAKIEVALRTLFAL